LSSSFINNNRALRKSGDRIRKSTGYGGIGRILSVTPQGSVSKFDSKKNKHVKIIADSILDNVDGAILGEDFKKAIFVGDLAALTNLSIPGVGTTFNAAFNLYTETSLGSVPGNIGSTPGIGFTTKEFAPVLKTSSLKKGGIVQQGLSAVRGGIAAVNNSMFGTDLTVLTCKHFDFTPSTSYVSEIEVFANSIPTYEFSRCVPHLDFTFFTATKPLNNRGKPLSISLSKAAVGSEGAGRFEIGTRMMAQGAESILKKQNSQFGIEMFTMPQTFVPINSKNRSTPILDPFKPFMSIKSFDISVVPAAGLMEKKKASLKIVLHDRSRLHEIAEIIRPENFGTNEILVEYGWSHPDKSGRNEYANFLNAMKNKEKYAVYNSSFSLNSEGGVDIDLTLFAKGNLTVENTTIIDNPAMKDIGKVIGEIESKINKILSENPRTDKKRKNISATQIIDGYVDGNVNVEGSQIFLNMENGKNEILSNLTEPSHLSLMKELQKIKSQKSELKSTKVEILDAIKEQLFNDTADPFYPSETATNDIAGPLKPLPGVPKNEYISVGKLFSMFVGRPLCSSNKYAEVQLFFYGFSDDSGFHDSSIVKNPLSKYSIDQFLIRKDDFIDMLDKMIESKGTANIPIQTFITRVINNFIKHPFSTLSNVVTPGMIYRKIMKLSETSGVSPAAIAGAQISTASPAESYKDLAKKYRSPNIQIRFDALPVASALGLDSSARKSVLRVHIFDSHNGRMTPYVNAIKAGSNTMETLKLSSAKLSDALKLDPSEADRKKAANDALAEIIESDLFGIKILPGITPEFKLDIPFKKLKKIISQGYPTLTYGSDGSILTSAKFSTIQNKKFADVQLTRYGKNPNKTAAGTDPRGLPMKILPTEAQVTMMGCPLIKYAQHFFIDFGTNTSADDLYYVKTISHSFKPGSFTTSLSMMARDADGAYESLFGLLDKATKVLSREKEASIADKIATAGETALDLLNTGN